MSTLYWPYLAADYYRGLEIVTAVVGIIILLSSLDDLFIDGWFWVRRCAAGSSRTGARLTRRSCAPGGTALAIMVPAWLEYDVIASMLETMVSTLEYKNYMIFAGTYQNDERTIKEVERMRRRYRQLVRVEVPHDGPTCKADCLNWIVQAIFAQNEKQPEPFAGVILHDSEDVLHPLELKYYNYLLRASTSSTARDLAGARLARARRRHLHGRVREWHTADLVVRESLSKMVLSAGVGSRRALMELAAETNNQPFNTDTLTEDYDIGARLAQRGMRQIFGKFPVEYVARRRSWFGLGPEKVTTLSMPLGVREYFPQHLPHCLPAEGPLDAGHRPARLAASGLDRIVRHPLPAVPRPQGPGHVLHRHPGLSVAGELLPVLSGRPLRLVDRVLPSYLRPGGWLVTLMWLNAVALLLRVVQRMYFVGNMYGWEHAVLSVPRMIVGNFINAMAAARAWKLFIGHLITGKRLAWDKTMHDFPSTDQLAQQRQRLGEPLLSWQAIDEDKLAQALEIQARDKKPLGTILLEQGWLDAGTPGEAIDFQQGAQAQAAPPTTDDKPATP